MQDQLPLVKGQKMMSCLKSDTDFLKSLASTRGRNTENASPTTLKMFTHVNKACLSLRLDKEY